MKGELKMERILMWGMERILIWGIALLLIFIFHWQRDKAMKKQRLRLRMTTFFDTLLLCKIPLESWHDMIQQRRIVERIFGKLTRKEYDFLFKVCEARQSNGGEPLELLSNVYMKD
jgi:hypothetical protein